MGTFYYSNHDKYEGEFVDGMMEGNGKFKWADGDVFMGTWKANKRDGEGRFIPKVGEPVTQVYSMGVEVESK